jgi:hypothetical protein
MPIIFNDRKTVGLELDILIPNINLAFELNGIIHYYPIYGDKKYNSTIINDQKKSDSCKDKNIDLKIIDLSKWGNFSEKKAEVILNDIEKIIDEYTNIFRDRAYKTM